MDESLKTILLASIPGIISIIVVLMQRRKDVASAKKDDSSAAKDITDSAMTLIEPLNKEINKLKLQVAELEKKVDQQDEMIRKYNVGTKKLMKQLCDNDINPIWTPVFIEEK